MRLEWLGVVGIWLIGWQDMAAQNGAAANGSPLSEYDFSQFIVTSHQTPEQIARLDNNGAILMACVRGATRDDLRAMHIVFAESQIALLEAFRLLEERGDRLRTTFPILDTARAAALRAKATAVARHLAGRTEPAVNRLVVALKRMGRGNNTYTILFSYILDNLVWTEFEEHGLLKRREITASSPFWAGEIWAIRPVRAFAMGTNSASDRGVSLKVNWTERAIPKMLPFVTEIAAFTRMFDDYVEKGRVEDPRARQVFAPFELFDGNGRFTVPIITSDPDDSLFRMSQEISHLVAQSALQLMALDSLTTAMGFRDSAQSLVLLYHEVMWELMDALEARGLVIKPVIFAAPDRARPSDVGALVFIVRKSQLR